MRWVTRDFINLAKFLHIIFYVDPKQMIFGRIEYLQDLMKKGDPKNLILYILT